MDNSMEQSQIPSQPINIQPVTPPSPQKSNLPMVLLMLLLLFVFTGVGVVLGKFLFTPPTTPVVEKTQLLPSPTIVVMASPTPTVDPTASWKTYTNEKYRYSIKYPQEVKLEEGSGYEERIQETILTFFGPKYQSPGEWTDGFGITSAIIKNPSQKTPTQFAQERYKQAGENIKNKILEGDISKCKVETVMKNNIEGTRFTYCTQAPGSGILNFSEWYVKNGITYQIYAVLQNGDYRITFDQILGTFKFLDQSQTDETANWKTFTSVRCELSIKYPPEWNAEEIKLVPGMDNPNYNYGCVGILAPDYKIVGESKTGLGITIDRTKPGAVFKTTTINSLEDFIRAHESISEPPIAFTVKRDAQYGSYSGKYYVASFFETTSNFVFTKNSYIYNISWTGNYSGQYQKFIEPLISSIK